MYNRYTCYPTLNHCDFVRNSSSKYGGGIMNSTRGKPLLTDCRFIENWANSSGGAIHYGYNMVINRCIFKGNGTGGNGGALVGGSKPVLTNCLLVGNTATGKGGAFYNSSDFSGTRLRNCTLVANSAGTCGGIYTYRSKELDVESCIVWGNSDESGEGRLAQISGGIPLVTYSCATGWENGIGNIDIDPCFVEPGYWDPNETPGDANDDFWVNGDYHLLEDSPCINKGDPNYTPEPNETDLDSHPRIIGGRIDMGAYEFNHIPVADAGSDQTVYVWFDEMAKVMLDGTGSYDDDGQSLTYLWTWNIDGNNFTATDPSPIIDLPVGEHTIELTVNDGIDNSELDEVIITVLPPIETAVKLTPKVLNTDSHGKWVKAHFVMPEGYSVYDVDVNTPATMEPLGIKSEYINVFINEDGLVEIEIGFDRAAVCLSGLNYGPIEIAVVGMLTSGQYFYGIDTIRVTANNLNRIAVFASHWLESGCSTPDWCGGTDLDYSSTVNFIDFTMFDSCCIEVIRNE
jgi:hypothetical protein